jgi:hypothetical protein
VRWRLTKTFRVLAIDDAILKFVVFDVVAGLIAVFGTEPIYASEITEIKVISIISLSTTIATTSTNFLSPRDDFRRNYSPCSNA